MKTLNCVVAATVIAGAAMVDTSAFAFPGFDDAPRISPLAIERARIVCEPLGRCFRIDAYSRRIFVPRPFGFGRPGFEGPGFNEPAFGRPGFGEPDRGRPGFGRPGFGDDDRARQGDQGQRRRPQPDQNERPGNPGAGQMQPHPGEQGGGQMQPRPGNGQQGGNPQRRQRPLPQQDGGPQQQ